MFVCTRTCVRVCMCVCADHQSLRLHCDEEVCVYVCVSSLSLLLCVCVRIYFMFDCHGFIFVQLTTSQNVAPERTFVLRDAATNQTGAHIDR